LDATSAPPASQRLASIDAYRGATMLLLASAAARGDWWRPIADAWPAWRTVLEQFEHAAWRGLTLWDMIQPSFMFLVGVSLPFSIASRQRRGATNAELWRHALIRALALVLLGVALRSLGHGQTNWTFEDVVSQIGLGYLPLFALAMASDRVRMATIAALLIGVWLLFVCWPLPSDSTPPVEAAVLHFDGFWEHWNQSTGPGHALDVWLLNLFPRSEPFTHDNGGYYTLNFIPSLATMALGLIAGDVLRRESSPRSKLLTLVGCGFALLSLGVALDALGVFPIVKKLWTPGFALASGGVCLLLLAAFYWIVDTTGPRRCTWPLEVVGRNPLAMYVMTWVTAEWLLGVLRTHLGTAPLALFGEPFVPLFETVAVGFLLWGVCWWMDRNRVYIRL
jgi:predicted acyltransferase